MDKDFSESKKNLHENYRENKPYTMV